MRDILETIKSDKPKIQGNEGGFTLVELIIVTAIIGILSAIGTSSFLIYKSDAEFSKAESDLRNARTAIELGLQEAERTNTAVAFALSDANGGPVSGLLAQTLPGATISKGVELGAEVNPCTASAATGISQFVISRSCKAKRYKSWIKQCGGIEITLPDVVFGGC